MSEGYQALTQSAAAIDLSGRTRIRCTGEDRARLLHALTTNHIQQLLPGHGCYAFFLNANGRVLADANILAFVDHILVDAEPDVRTSLWAHIDHYIIADDVNLYDDAESTFALGVEGPHARERLTALGAVLPEDDFAHVAWNDLTVARLAATGKPGYRLFGSMERKQAVLDLLYLPVAAAEDVEAVRIEHSVPRYGADIGPSNIAAETGLTQALHFQKGCYLGQEIVERVRSRGHLNKRLVALEFDGGAAAAGARLVVEGKEVGEITSSARSAGLAYVRVPHDQPGSVLEVAGGIARVK